MQKNLFISKRFKIKWKNEVHNTIGRQMNNKSYMNSNITSQKGSGLDESKTYFFTKT